MGKNRKHKKGEIKRLEELVRYHNKKYFIDNDPEISDEEFDAITENLRRLKPNSPALYEIVGKIGSVVHKTPILSIDKRFSHKDIIRWVKDTNSEKFLVQPKYDGMRARYQNGILATRGNGLQGEDITRRFKYLNIKGQLSKKQSDGEIIIPLSYFNKYLSKAYKNPRNAVVGIIKSKVVKKEGIKALLDGGVHFVIYDSIHSMRVSSKKLIDEESWEEILEQTLRVDYPLDGIVIKVEDEKIRKKTGRTQHHYKWEIAYKLPAQRKWSYVLDIKEQVGRTGRITSVAKIKPVKLSGATVSNVTLHNYEYVINSKIGIGSKVEVTRSGEVIPFITKVESEGVKPYVPKKICPVCGNKAVLTGKYLECVNPNCPSRLAQSFEYFFKVLNVDELGGKTIERFINEFKIKNVIGFYDLTEDQIASLEGFGKKSARNITENIKKTLNGTVTKHQLLQALGLKEIGPATSKWILDKFGFDKLPTLTENDLTTVNGMGPVKAKYFVNELRKKWWVVEELKKRGLKFSQRGDRLEGLSFAITGSFEKQPRTKIIEQIRKNGGEYKSSVTKTLDYIIVGSSPGAKLKKAEKYGIKQLSLTDFHSLLRNMEHKEAKMSGDY